jgi:CheY-like chemotaxis protein
LDLNLPGLDGREILSQIKQDETLKAIPIVIFTTSSNPKDVKTCYQRGSNGYIMKPIDARKLKHTLERFIEYWFELSALPDCYL